MRPALAYFSVRRLTDPTKHHEYNEYHQLDHRPENLALPSVIFGERWVRSPEAASLVPTPPGRFSGVQYITMYWLKEPVEASRLEWWDLGTTATHLGRRPDSDYTDLPLMAPFIPLKGYANPRVRVSAEALPFRPAKGIFVTVGALDDDIAQAERLGGWYDRVRVPEILELPGVAGAWTFMSEHGFPGRPLLTEDPRVLRIHVYFLDGDVAAFASALHDRGGAWGDAGPLQGVETPLFASVLRTIVPWEWDWFEADS